MAVNFIFCVEPSRKNLLNSMQKIIFGRRQICIDYSTVSVSLNALSGVAESGCISTTIEVSSDIYFTFDIDGIDPTFAPGTGTPEVGGFNVREAQTIIRALNKINFVGGDVVEVSPPFDVNNMTSLVGATIAFEMLCTMTKVN